MAFFDSAFAADGSYNTITSQEEAAAASTGNEQTGTQKFRVFKSGDLPFNRIMSAVMRSAAAVQGQEQAKTLANQQAEENSKLSLSVKAGPHGPIATIKNVSLDKLNQTEQENLQQAYTQPGQQVEKKIAAMNGTTADSAVAKPLPDHLLEPAAVALEESLGYHVIRPWGDEIRNSTTSLDSLVDVGERLGIPDARKHATDAWKRLQKGQISPDTIRRNLANIATKRIEVDSHNLQTTLQPYQEAKQHKQEEADRQRTATRLEQTQKDTEREKVLKHKEDLIKTFDYIDTPWSEVPTRLEAQNRSGVPMSQADILYAQNIGQQKIREAFGHFINPKGEGTFALGDYDTWDEAKRNFGWDNVREAFAANPAAVERMDKQGYVAWHAAHKYAVRKQEEADRREERDNLQRQRTLQLLANATKEKPATVGRSDLDLMSVDELLSTDQSKVKNYDSLLRQKEDLLRKHVQAAKDEWDAATQESQALIDAAPGYKDFRYASDLAAKRVNGAIAKRKLDAANAELQKIQQARGGNVPRGTPQQQPSATPPPKQVAPAKSVKKGAPKIGDKKTFTAGPYAGKTGTWDGISYVIPR